MRRIVIDIETCAYPFESLAESQKEYLLRYAEKESETEKRQMMVDDAIRYTSLYPYTAKCIAIGIFDVEKEMLKSFWRVANAADQIITFNGRNFDIPFLMMRSAMLKIKVTKNLMSYRYGDEHIDLLEKFTFYGATRKFNLDFYCNAFGIESPKSYEVSGMEVKNLYEAGRLKDIAVYCSRDIYATYNLFKIWSEYLNLK